MSLRYAVKCLTLGHAQKHFHFLKFRHRQYFFHNSRSAKQKSMKFLLVVEPIVDSVYDYYS
jgi:hypothetical protein